MASPEVSHLDIQLAHAIRDFFPSGGCPVEGERGSFGFGTQITPNDEVLLSLGGLELDFDVTSFLIILNKSI